MSSTSSSKNSSISNLLEAFNLPKKDKPLKGRDSPGRLRLPMDNEENEESTYDDLNDPSAANLSADPDLNPMIHYNHASNNLLGEVVLDLLREITELANQGKKKMNLDVEDVCRKLHNFTLAQNHKMKRRIMQTTADWEQSMIEKELNSHTLNQSVEAPITFSPVPTLLTPKQLIDCHKLLPSGAHKFAGAPHGMSIEEYLHNLNEMQEHCNLSLTEFYKAMLASTTGGPYKYIIRAVKNEEEPANVYHNLLMRYDTRLSPEEARAKLYAYKIPKSATLATAETQIQELAHQAMSALPAGPSRTAAYNHEVIQALLRSLPVQSSIMVRNHFSQLSSKLGRSATAAELSRLLNTYRYSVDQDIKSHGDTRQGMEPRKFFPRSANKTARPIKRYTTFSVAQPTQSASSGTWTRSAPRARPSVGQQVAARPVNFMTNQGRPRPSPGGQSRPASFGGYRPNQFRPNVGGQMNGRASQPRTNFSPRIVGQGMGQGNFRGNSQPGRFRPRGTGRPAGGNRDYCSLCGKRNHRAVDGCRAMVNNAGQQVPVMPTKDTCPDCPVHIQPRLSHPRELCPFRAGGPLGGK